MSGKSPKSLKRIEKPQQSKSPDFLRKDLMGLFGFLHNPVLPAGSQAHTDPD